MRRLLGCALCALWLWGCQSEAPRAVSTPTPYQGTLVAFGDSLTEGLGVEPSEAYPAVLQRRLDKDGLPWQVINAGLSGETSTGALSRLDWVMRLKPQAVILETGGNDALRGIDPALTEKNLDALLTAFDSKGVGVLLAGMQAPENAGKDYVQRFAALYPRLAKAHRVDLIPFFLEGVAGRPQLNQPDRMHPTKEGYLIIVERIAPQVERLLKARR